LDFNGGPERWSFVREPARRTKKKTKKKENTDSRNGSRGLTQVKTPSALKGQCIKFLGRCYGNKKGESKNQGGQWEEESSSQIKKSRPKGNGLSCSSDTQNAWCRGHRTAGR